MSHVILIGGDDCGLKTILSNIESLKLEKSVIIDDSDQLKTSKLTDIDIRIEQLIKNTFIPPETRKERRLRKRNK